MRLRRRSVDIEDVVRQVLAEYYTAYVDPLPKSYGLPFLRVTSTGGSEANRLDAFAVELEGYAETDAEACEILRNAVGILRDWPYFSARETSKPAPFQDPLRPDLCRYRTSLLITAHQEYFTLNGGN